MGICDSYLSCQMQEQARWSCHSSKNPSCHMSFTWFCSSLLKVYHHMYNREWWLVVWHSRPIKNDEQLNYRTAHFSNPPYHGRFHQYKGIITLKLCWWELSPWNYLTWTGCEKLSELKSTRCSLTWIEKPFKRKNSPDIWSTQMVNEADMSLNSATNPSICQCFPKENNW